MSRWGETMTECSTEPVHSALGKTIVKQHRASNPVNCAWVSANAGSGKTYVLAQRVIRLLLNGVAPSKILCLTFTKAAAAEMANRVFRQLGDWATLDEPSLRKEIISSGEVNPSKQMLREARELFTRAMESPGGLKIQTIHAFCESLLHQFTLEANTSGHFDVIDTHEQNKLMENAFQSVLASTMKDKKLADALATIMHFSSDHGMEKGLEEVISRRETFLQWLRFFDGDVVRAVRALGREMKVDIDEKEDELTNRLLRQLPIGEKELHEFGLVAGSLDAARCKELARHIAAFGIAKSGAERFAARLRIYQTKAKVFQKTKPSAGAFYKLVPGTEELFQAEFEAVHEIADYYNNWKLLQSSAGLFVLANEVISLFERSKRARGLLDYDDLINRTANLLARSDVRQWVQYKLDAGIDHVLVDEAQDTSPAQWEIVNAITEEFFVGQLADEKPRTIFAVGDQKQSIFSFQGAEPELFSRQKNDLGQKALDARLAFEKIDLEISFRSTRDILSAVDMVFSNPQFADGLQSANQEIIHEPNRQSDPGEVLIWPMITGTKSPEQKNWLEPVDKIREDHPAVQLAKRITETIEGWIETGEILAGQGRKITPGDILILVRKRDRFASAITRALKQAGLKVAGADRLNLVGHIAIQDLLSLSKWVLFPEDDLSLAEALKSPLFDFSDEDLLEICVERGDVSLWQSMRLLQSGANQERFNKVATMLSHLLARGRDTAPFEFYSEILGVLQGRKKFKARLGDEVDDVLDAFLLEAMNHTTNGGFGLQGFIHNLEVASPEIKRELDLERDEIRVMTVHSAKGLEAGIVFLVDPGGAAYSGTHRPVVIEAEAGLPVPGLLWQPSKEGGSAYTDAIYHKIIQKAEQEYRRLLYVGMTRAEDRLIICGFTGFQSHKHMTWHKMVHSSLADKCEEVGENGELRWVADHPLRKPRAEADKERAHPQEAIELPSWIDVAAGERLDYSRTTAPSVAGYDETYPAVRGSALERGNATHILLQILPQLPNDRQSESAIDYLAAHFSYLDMNLRDDIVREVMAVLHNSEFARIFGQGSRAELAITGIVEPGGLNRQVNGQIDRVSFVGEQILITDFKTDRIIPDRVEDISEKYLLQMAIYRELIGHIYPGRPITSALLWTSGPQLTEIGDDILSEIYQGWLADEKKAAA